MRALIISLKTLLLFTVLTGVVYPLIITGLAQVLFPGKANGSLIVEGNKVIGSELIGQKFDSLIYFSSRPSSIGYNPLPSGGSNYGLTSTRLRDLATARKREFTAKNKLDSLTVVPSEMVFASASGLDPHISPEAALMQVDRIVQARNFDSEQKQKLENIIITHTEAPQFMCIGEERVNVLWLNLEINKIK